MNNIKNIIFDLDGTLWDSREQIIQAWKNTLQNSLNLSISADDLNSIMGKTNEAIKEKFFKDFDDDIAEKYLNDCQESEVKYLNKYGANIYNETLNTINKLSSKYNLFIVSNCQSGYIESFIQYYKLEDKFKDIECSGNTNKDKSYNTKIIIKRNNLDTKDTCFIGDTEGDYIAAKNNNLTFIYANYGFGNCNTPDIEINSIEELLNILK
jgi:phosphoglycolate phosphatase